MRLRPQVAAVMMLLAACGTAPAPEAFQGVWASRGWGIVLHVDGADADVYELSATHCVLASAGSARGIEEVVTITEAALVLRDSGRMIVFDPLPALPAECDEAPDATPAGVVAATVAAVEEHFHPGVDSGWRQRAAAAATADALGLEEALHMLLAPLGDPGIALQTDGAAWSPPRPEVATVLGERLLAGTHLGGSAAAAGDGIVSADLADGIAYLGFLRLGGFADTAASSQRVLSAALDLTLREASAIVLDLRAAGSGTEVEALLAATRFVQAVTVVAATEARLPDGELVPAGEAVVHPMPTGAFPGQVVILVGPGTAGAGELLALALAELPNVTVVGEPTAGSPRAPLVRTLPNGWALGVPNTEVTTPDGVARVGTPLQPSVVAPLRLEDLFDGRDPGLEAARDLLGV